jgi:3',5'-nucleoside bisphosphate phosphatase
MSAVQTVDLHCHSTISDGVLQPATVVARAAANGVELLALTDHDNLAGVGEAAAAASAAGIRLVPGVEISVSWRSTTIHVLGLGVDPHDATLNTGLESIRAGRAGRSERMAESLAGIGIHGALEGAARYAHNPQVLSRTHFARFLVERGIAPDVHSVFDNYLVRGKPGFVPHEWASLAQAVSWILAAGGIAVAAHPARYRLGKRALDEFFTAFQALGGSGIEVCSGSQTPEQDQEMARVARRFGFLASTGSDFHAPEESMLDLGHSPPLPPDLVPVWQRLA